MVVAGKRVTTNGRGGGRAILRRLGLAGLLLGAIVVPAMADTPRPTRTRPAPREVTVVNRARLPILQLMVSPTAADQWGEDRLGEATIPPGAQRRTDLGRTAECQFDIQVVYEDLGREERRGVDLCRTRTVTFDGTAASRPEDPFTATRMLTLVNRTPRAISGVFVSPAAATQWGDDLAPGRGIAPGETGVLTYRGACAADLRVVFDNRAAEERRGLDICATATVTVRPGWTTVETLEQQASPVASGPAEGELELVNATGRVVLEVSLEAEGSEGRLSADLLGSSVLAVGGRLAVPFEHGTTCHYTAVVSLGGDRGRLVQGGIDLCRERRIELRPPAGGRP